MKNLARDKSPAKPLLKPSEADLVQTHNSPAKRATLKAGPLRLSTDLPPKQQVEADVSEELFLLFRDMQETLTSLLPAAGSSNNRMDAILNSKEAELRSFIDRNCRDFVFLLRNMFQLVHQTKDKERTVQKSLKELGKLDPGDSFHVIAALERRVVDLKSVGVYDSASERAEDRDGLHGEPLREPDEPEGEVGGGDEEEHRGRGG